MGVKIKRISLVENEDVYNMEVKNHHNFSINGGLIVHNCDSFGYGLLAYHASKSGAAPGNVSRLAAHKAKKARDIRRRRRMS
jgi:hypothetical protein